MATSLSLINFFKGGPVTVERSSAGSHVNGIYQAGEVEIIETVMSIQPLNGREVIKRAEGHRERNYMYAYSPIELYVTDQQLKRMNDKINYNNKVYEVLESEFWDSSNLSIAPHWKCLIAEVNYIG